LAKQNEEKNPLQRESSKKNTMGMQETPNINLFLSLQFTTSDFGFYLFNKRKRGEKN
jgi:hypothetical protein